MQQRRVQRLVGGACLSVALLLVTPVSEASAHRPPAGDYVTQYIPAADEPPSGTPSVVPIVECVVRGRRIDTYWFGYRTLGIHPFVRIGKDPSGREANFIEQVTAGGESTDIADRGQVEFFLDGRQRMAFAVSVPVGDELSWTLTTPAVPSVSADSQHAAWLVTVSTADPPPCRGGADRRSATARAVTGEMPRITTSADRDAFDNGRRGGPTGIVGFTAAGVTSACNAGGTPLPPAVLWGYEDAVTAGAQALSPDVPRDGFVPLNRRQVVGVEVLLPGVSVQRSWSGVRRVADPAREWINPTNGVVSHGVAVTNVIADVYGRCRYGDDVVVGTHPLWISLDGNPHLVVTITDELTGAPRVPASCTTEPDCTVPLLPGPGGGRWR